MFREKLLQDALRHYAGQHVLDRVLREGRGALEYTAQRQVMTMLFIDVAGIFPDNQTPPFQPGTLRSWLLDYQTLVCRSIEEYHGTVDGFIGDAVMAHWNMLPQVDHAALALRCAEHLVSSIAALSAAQQTKGLPGMRPLIGIHSGQVDLGNHGTRDRMRFTVMGDAVNLAFRLCGRCYQYGVPVLLTDASLALAGNAVATSEVDTIRIKGKDNPIKLYTLGNAYVAPEKSVQGNAASPGDISI
jgi:adenylate cyclase